MDDNVIREVRDDNALIATQKPASAEAVVKVLNTAVGDPDGRSGFKWLRLVNGDLILAIYPLGDTYMEVAEMEDV